jgi:NADH-quinone oxidoreductase subunit C
VSVSNEHNQQVMNTVSGKFPETLWHQGHDSDLLNLQVPRERLTEVLAFLRDEASLNYNFLTTLCGMHDIEKEELGVVYHLHSFSFNHRIRVKTSAPLAKPEIPSITGLWPSANWMERETYDFYGILFTGHPNLTRILNVDEMKDFPLRKDFPLEDQTREDKDDSMFGR